MNSYILRSLAGYFKTKSMSGIHIPFTYVVKHTNTLFRKIEIILPWGENV